MKFFKNDYNLGLKSEIETLPILRNFFKDDIRKTSGKFNEFDFVGDNTFYELKTRTNNYNKYPTTIIGFNKIKSIDGKSTNKDTKFYFVFKFIDGIYYYEYNINDKFEVKKGGRNDRFDYKGNRINEYKDYYYIPIDKLISIS